MMQILLVKNKYRRVTSTCTLSDVEVFSMVMGYKTVPCTCINEESFMFRSLNKIASNLSHVFYRGTVVGLFSLGIVSTASAQSVCVFDPAGKAGDYYRLLDQYALEASSWGVSLEVKVYTDEETAVKDYEAKQCDAVVATGVRLARFNNFPTTIEAIGALPTYPLLKSMTKTLTTSGGAAKMLTKSGNATVGIIPMGAVYVFVRDRSIDTVEELAGKKIATMDYDKPSVVMVEKIGAIMVPADLGSIGPKFNNGDVDACYISAPAYQPFELWKGLGETGGVVRLPIAQATLQVMAREEAFPADFSAKSREFFWSKFDEAMGYVSKAEAGIPSKYWIEIPAADIPDFDEMFQRSRIELRDNHSAYHPKMLGVMRDKRCAADATRPECAEDKE